MRRVCLIGAGFISHVHAEVLHNLPNVALHGVIDANASAAAALAAQWRIPRIFGSIEEAVCSGQIDCVHVLTPPALHAETALPFIRAGTHVFLEKPLAISRSECGGMIAEAMRSNATLGVNQNFIFHPAFIRLRRALSEHRYGRPNFVSCIYNMPLRQIATRQFGHWMFLQPVNILLEQAVHPLSQIVALAGEIGKFVAIAGPPMELSPGVPFYASLSLSLKGANLPAELRFAVGQSFPFWQISVVCDDGVLVADILNNRLYVHSRGRWIEAFDAFYSGSRTGFQLMREGLRNAMNFSLATARLRPRSDGFFQSMKGCIGAFHQSLNDNRTPEIDGKFGTHLVGLCEDIAQTAFQPSRIPAPRQDRGNYDVVVLGGTGFIGTHVVRRLVAEGRRVGVMARNTVNLPQEFYRPEVVIISGDIRRVADVERAIGNASIVLNLAHGGGGATYHQVRAAMVGGLEVVARACLALGVRRLIHVGSIASLYLGSQKQVITGSTPPDTRAAHRADYARAKAECDEVLLAMHKLEGLPVCILRPGLVVGEGGVPTHSGLGSFNNEQHCIGWNRGKNPLPFVLVEDVAAAVWRACESPKVIGRTYNIVGDTRLSAREYLDELATALSRPLRFHPQWPTILWLEETAKWTVKVAVGRHAARTTLHDLLSRGLTAEFDCDDAKKDLDWRPESDRQRFIERGIRVFAKARSAT